MNEDFKKRLKDLWIHKSGRRKEPRTGQTDRRSGGSDRQKDDTFGKAARGGGQTPGSKVVDWVNKLINRDKKIGPVS